MHGVLDVLALPAQALTLRAAMSSKYASLADQLVHACASGDIASAEAAIALGASVNDPCTVDCAHHAALPLDVAAAKHHYGVVVWLLSRGADPNGHRVMWSAAFEGTPEVLQLLIDAGGDANRPTAGDVPMFAAIYGEEGANVRLLLSQPFVDLGWTRDGKTPEQCASEEGLDDVAAAITEEVRPVRAITGPL